jgi:hypothetical protein
MSLRRILGVLGLAALGACGTSTQLASSGGADSGVPVVDAGSWSICFGTPLPCEDRSSVDCTSTLGCATGVGCDGVETSCVLLFNQIECTSQEGCSWDTTASRCSGTATPCDLVVACSEQQGCTTEETCSGTPASCGSFSQAECDLQPGCMWGTPPSPAGDASAIPDAAPPVDAPLDAAAGDAGDASEGGTGPMPCQGVTCDPSHDTACAKNTCVPSTGQCAMQPVNNNGNCDDGLFCTVGEYCLNGTCVGGSLFPCFDSCRVCSEASRSCVVESGQCEITGSCVASGTLSPTNACESCQPATSQTAWSPVAQGTACSSSNACETATTCDGAGTCSGPPLAPPAPVAASPRAGALTGSLLAPSSFAHLRPTFRWSEASDACATVPTYDIQVDDSCALPGWRTCTFPSPEASATGLTVTQFQPGSDLPVSTAVPVGTRYYWRVRACRGTACSAWSSPSYLDVGRAHSDIDGDGYSDLIASQLDFASYEGHVYGYRGGASGIASTPTSSMSLGAPLPGTRQYFGVVMVTGDVNADGFADLVVNAPSFDDQTTEKDAEGVVYVYYGSATGLPSSPSVTLNATGTSWPTGMYWSFGYAIAAAGDVDDDGFADVVVNRIASAVTDSPAGVYAGSPSGVGSTPNYFLSGAPNSFYGGYPLVAAIATDGDLNGDGVADIILSLPITDSVGYGGAFAYPGRVGGPTGSPKVPSDNASVFSNVGPYGQALFTSADLDGNGVADLLAGAGTLYGFYNQWAAHSFSIANPTAADIFATGFTAASFDGTSIPQIAAGDWINAPYSSGAGYVYLFHPGVASPFATISSPAAIGPQFGRAVQRAGDVNADGYDDLAVGDPSTAQGYGAVYLYEGGKAGLPSAPTISLSSPAVGGNFGNFGHSLAQ